MNAEEAKSKQPAKRLDGKLSRLCVLLSTEREDDGWEVNAINEPPAVKADRKSVSLNSVAIELNWIECSFLWENDTEGHKCDYIYTHFPAIIMERCNR